MSSVSLYCFGTPRIERDGSPVEIDTRKALALLAYLALGGGSQSRDSLAALLYAEYDQSSARAALRRTLSSLRKALGAEILTTDRDTVSLAPGNLWVDVLAFRENLATIKKHSHPASETCQTCLRLLVDSVDLYQDDFLAGFGLRSCPEFDDWQFFQSESLRQDLAGVLEKLALALTQDQDFEGAVQVARRWLALDQLREEAHRTLMLVYAWKGQRNAALRQYRECVRILDRELGVPPLEETTRLYRAILENKLPEVPAVKISEPVTLEAPRKDLRPEVYPFVGRARELQKLQQAYSSAGGGFIFALDGEAGIGKTRLATEFLALLHSRGVHLIQGRCYEGETDLAYAPFIEALAPLLASPQVIERLRGLPAYVLGVVAQLLPGLAGQFPGLPAAPSPDATGAQLRFYQAVQQVLLVLLAGEQPGVLFLDDMHWSDGASLDLLAYLVRRTQNVFFLLTWRSSGLAPDHPLHVLLSQAAREGRGERLSLKRLLPENLAEIIAQFEPAQRVDLAGRLYEETEGNPFFVVEYLKSASLSAGQPWAIPQSVRDLLQSRLSKAGDLGIQLLSTAAVVGRSFDYDILREVSGRGELETITGLETLLAQGLVVEQAGGEPVGGTSYDFTHEKLRAFVYDGVSLARRRLLHLRTAEALATRLRLRRDASSLAGLAAHHFQMANDPQSAAEYFRQAGEHARKLYANQDALTHFENALACSAANSAQLHEAIGDLHILMAEYNLAVEDYQIAATSGTPENLPGLEHKIGLAHHHRGDWDTAESHYRAALDGLGAHGDASLRARINADWSRTCYQKGQLERAWEYAQRAKDLAELSADRRAIGQTDNMLGILARARGDLTSAVLYLERSLRIAIDLADPAAQAAALNNLAHVTTDAGDLPLAIQYAEKALEHSLQQGDRHRAAALHNNLADLFHSVGESERAMEHLKKAVVIFAEIGSKVGESQTEIWKLVEW